MNLYVLCSRGTLPGRISNKIQKHGKRYNYSAVIVWTGTQLDNLDALSLASIYMWTIQEGTIPFFVVALSWRIEIYISLHYISPLSGLIFL